MSAIPSFCLGRTSQKPQIYMIKWIEDPPITIIEHKVSRSCLYWAKSWNDAWKQNSITFCVFAKTLLDMCKLLPTAIWYDIASLLILGKPNFGYKNIVLYIVKENYAVNIVPYIVKENYAVCEML